MGQASNGRTWKVMLEDCDDFRGVVEQELVDLWPLVFRGGRGVIVAPLRRRDELGEYETIGVAFKETFIPAVGRPPEAAEETPMVELSAELAEA